MDNARIFKALGRAVACAGAAVVLLGSGSLAHAQIAAGKPKFLGNTLPTPCRPTSL